MNEKEELNLTLPIILIGLITIGLFVFFSVSGNGGDFLKGEQGDKVKESLTASAYHFIAPNVVQKGEKAVFSWKADVSRDAVCVGKTESESSDGGWTGTKSAEGKQEVGPILENTAYYLDCTDGEKMIRDVELVSVVKEFIAEE